MEEVEFLDSGGKTVWKNEFRWHGDSEVSDGGLYLQLPGVEGGEFALTDLEGKRTQLLPFRGGTRIHGRAWSSDGRALLLAVWGTSLVK